EVVISHNAYREACRVAFRNFWRNAFRKRISFEDEVFRKLIEDASLLDRLDEYLHPLFSKDLEKAFILERALDFEAFRAGEEGEPVPEAEAVADASTWLEEMRRQREERDALFRGSLLQILDSARGGGTTLERLREDAEKDGTILERLAPSTGIFSGLLLQLVRGGSFSVRTCDGREPEDACGDGSADIGVLLADIAESEPGHRRLSGLRVRLASGGREVLFEGLNDGEENQKSLVCTDLEFIAEYGSDKEAAT
ncbi:MAG: hypothetical protein J5600_00280, partial [Desulfovibrio sp.]|nr:hypothetical protein [Desulfovibrio sp.]